MFPNDSHLYIEEERREFLFLDNALYNPKTCYERGGIDMSDPSLGLLYQTWYLRYENKQFLLRSEDGKEYLLRSLDEDIDLIKVSFSFDQNMKLAWGYTQRVPNSEVYHSKFFWYDTTRNDYQEVPLLNCRDVSVKLDDPRLSSNLFNDIVLLYIDIESWLCVRYQRDRYLKPKRLLRVPEYSVVSKLGLSRDYRFQIELRAVEPVKHKNNRFLLDGL